MKQASLAQHHITFTGHAAKISSTSWVKILAIMAGMLVGAVFGTITGSVVMAFLSWATQPLWHSFYDSSPSDLYGCQSESGLVLGAIVGSSLPLWWAAPRTAGVMIIAGSFLFGYSLFNYVSSNILALPSATLPFICTVALFLVGIELMRRKKPKRAPAHHQITKLERLTASQGDELANYLSEAEATSTGE